MRPHQKPPGRGSSTRGSTAQHTAVNQSPHPINNPLGMGFMPYAEDFWLLQVQGLLMYLLHLLPICHTGFQMRSSYLPSPQHTQTVATNPHQGSEEAEETTNRQDYSEPPVIKPHISNCWAKQVCHGLRIHMDGLARDITPAFKNIKITYQC